MIKFFLKFILLSLSLFFVVSYIPGVQIDSLYTAFIISLLWGILSIIVKPLLSLLALPIQILTLGLFSIFINALLVSFLASFVEGFTITGLFPAIILALFMSMINTILSLIY